MNINSSQRIKLTLSSKLNSTTLDEHEEDFYCSNISDDHTALGRRPH